ncbi:FixH family protein [Ramlibacter sp. AW1]|uniref:FixH family protein n=1 Tax=Ramlibacter aurantiacus TaxID=2801330 RepID=A0A937D574_9BURK|nr:FixH family protein [Ramlibacter aurantiacus]MBL0421042.1 FixH family protein [Ramlibacter aurantiacus]
MEPIESPGPAAAPWWRHGHVWLVIAGPVVAVVAGFTTLFLALSTSDPLVAQDYYRQGIEINRTLAAESAKALMPAMQGRNHAATPAPAQ